MRTDLRALGVETLRVIVAWLRVALLALGIVAAWLISTMAVALYSARRAVQYVLDRPSRAARVGLLLIGGFLLGGGYVWGWTDAASTIEVRATEMARLTLADYGQVRGESCRDVPGLPDGVRRWCAEIDDAAARAGIDPRAWALVIEIECPAGDPTCGSPAGARGLAQLMPGTAEGLAAETGLACVEGDAVTLDPVVNLACGAAYWAGALELAAEIDDVATRYAVAGIGYNAGHSRVPAAVEWWRAGGDVCEYAAGIAAETARYCRMVRDRWGEIGGDDE